MNKQENYSRRQILEMAIGLGDLPALRDTPASSAKIQKTCE